MDQFIHQVFHKFVGDNPTDEELRHFRVHMGHINKEDRYLQLNTTGTGRRWLLIYTSCHAEQIAKYIQDFRPDVTDQLDIILLFTHRMQLTGPSANNRLVWALFSKSDFVIANVLSHKFGVFSTDALFPHCRPDCRIVSFVPPCCACWWPVASHFGEEPVAAYMDQGLSAEAMTERFRAGTFDSLFAYRYKDQIERLAFRERNRDVKISDFIVRRHKAHKMFFTTNHPTFNLIAYITDECLSRIGFKLHGEDHALSLPVNHAGFGNHWPESDYEWAFYGFEYLKRFDQDYGGPNAYYSALIQRTVERRKALTVAEYNDSEDDY